MDTDQSNSSPKQSPYFSEFFTKKNKNEGNLLLRNFKSRYSNKSNYLNSPNIIKGHVYNTRSKKQNVGQKKNTSTENISKARKRIKNTNNSNYVLKKSKLIKHVQGKHTPVKSNRRSIKSQKMKPEISCTQNSTELIYLTKGQPVIDVNAAFMGSPIGTKLAYVETCVPRIDVTDYDTDSNLFHKKCTVNKDASNRLDHESDSNDKMELYCISNSNENEFKKISKNDDFEQCADLSCLSQKDSLMVLCECKFHKNKLLVNNRNETRGIETRSRFFQNDPNRTSKKIVSTIRFRNKRFRDNYVSDLDKINGQLNATNLSVDSEEFELFFNSVSKKIVMDINDGSSQDVDESKYENKCFKLRNSCMNIKHKTENINCQSFINKPFNDRKIHIDNIFQSNLIFKILNELKGNLFKLTTDNSTFDRFYIKNEKCIRKQIELNCFDVSCCSMFNSCCGSYFIKPLSDNVNTCSQYDNLDKKVNLEDVKNQSVSKYFNNRREKLNRCKPNICNKKQIRMSKEQLKDKSVHNIVFYVDNSRKNILSQFSFQANKSKLIIDKCHSKSAKTFLLQDADSTEKINTFSMEMMQNKDVIQIGDIKKDNIWENKEDISLQSVCNKSGRSDEKYSFAEKNFKEKYLHSNLSEKHINIPLDSLCVKEIDFINENQEISISNLEFSNFEKSLSSELYSNFIEDSKDSTNSFEINHPLSQSEFTSSLQEPLSYKESFEKDINLQKSQSTNTQSSIKSKFTFSQKKEVKKFTPPISPFGLIEEEYTKNPWALLVATIFLTKTSGKKAKPIIDQFLEENPDPESVIAKESHDFEHYFINLGLKKRSELIWKMSVDYIRNPWINAKDLRGIGKYGDDAYRMFILGDTTVKPTDKYLKKYLDWWLENLDDGEN